MTRSESRARKRLIELMYLDLDRLRSEHPESSLTYGNTNRYSGLRKTHPVYGKYPGKVMAYSRRRPNPKRVVLRSRPENYIYLWSVHESFPEFVKKWKSNGLDVLTLELVAPNAP